MRTLFALSLLLLGAALAVTRWSEPDLRSEVPILYWVIDPAPVRAAHIRLFHLWQITSGHCAEHTLATPEEVREFRRRRWSPAMVRAISEGNAQGAALLDGTLPAERLPVTIRVPKAELRLDAASNDMSKKMIQSVSGVAGDIMEAYGDGGVQYLASGGLLADLTEDAKRLAFSPGETYAALEPALSYDGRQYAFPRNPVTSMYWVNKDTFARHGQPLPPERWTFTEFESRGKAFVAAANPPGQRRKVFFADAVNLYAMRRSLGIDVFNETLTRCVLDDPRCAQMYALVLKWTEEDHLLPNSADRASFATQAGGWGSQAGQLFADGSVGMLLSGRYQLMQFRQFKPLPLAVVEPPHGGFPCNDFTSGLATVFRGTQHHDLAMLFLAFYASEDYSMQIVRDGDGLPPIPRYTEIEAYLRPPEHPNEWGCHEMFAENAIHRAIAISFSPFVQHGVVMECEWMTTGAVLAGRMTPAEAAHEVAERINREIDIGLKDNPRLKARHEAASGIQARIEARRAAGRPVPATWVANPFHRRHYEANGWLEDGGPGPAATRPAPAGEERNRAR